MSKRCRTDLYSSSDPIEYRNYILDDESDQEILYAWDKVFPTKALETINSAGKIRSHSFTSIFDRQTLEPRSFIEEAIVSILDELDSCTNTESGRYIEYWFRSTKKVRMLEAHRDIDETLCSKVQYPIELGSDIKIGKQVCPTFGHVLYLNVDNILAPTLVWDEETQDDAKRFGAPQKMKGVWSVPAVSNRLLRFDGKAMHAVCYPHLRPILGSEEIESMIKEEYLNEGSKKKERAVLLFNTWNDEPPLYPPINEPLSNEEESYYEYMGYMDRGVNVACNPLVSWEAQSITSMPKRDYGDSTTFRFPLLGGVSRRNCLKEYLEDNVSLGHATDALSSEFNVSKLYFI
ncbi:hypothetical protein CTEN210_06068 [Chaetoceros tenuissimus]|uniref:Uncharacterized protein n=1 Tax=Chaetoceros tenuissimus TaxID=426638 RepID=A0AAD3H3T7_9STRA|nr:hypothetical protein CTEN210_06068 [Chaetoceros tenuissimus]